MPFKSNNPGCACCIQPCWVPEAVYSSIDDFVTVGTWAYVNGTLTSSAGTAMLDMPGKSSDSRCELLVKMLTSTSGSVGSVFLDSSTTATTDLVEVRVTFGNQASPCGSVGIYLNGTLVMDRVASHHLVSINRTISIYILYDGTDDRLMVDVVGPDADADDRFTIAVEQLIPKPTYIGVGAASGEIAFSGINWYRHIGQETPEDPIGDCYNNQICGAGARSFLEQIHSWSFSDWTVDPTNRCDATVTGTGSQAERVDSEAAVLSDWERLNGYDVIVHIYRDDGDADVDYSATWLYCVRVSIDGGGHELRIYAKGVAYDANYRLVWKWELWRGATQLDSHEFPTDIIGATSFETGAPFTIYFGIRDTEIWAGGGISTGLFVHSTTTATHNGPDVEVELQSGFTTPTNEVRYVKIGRCYTDLVVCAICDDGLAPRSMQVELPDFDRWISPSVVTCTGGTFTLAWVGGCSWLYFTEDYELRLSLAANGIWTLTVRPCFHDAIESDITTTFVSATSNTDCENLYDFALTQQLTAADITGGVSAVDALLTAL